jgi:ABC-type sugar transport system substrate-binding protein
VDPLLSYPAWALSASIFKADAGKDGYKAKVVGPETIDPAAMVNMMDQAISAGAKGIIFCDLDPAIFHDEVLKAQRLGIVVVTIGCVDNISNYSIGTDNADFGRVAADLVAQKTGGHAQVGIVTTSQSTPNQVAQVDSFKARIAAKYPGIKVVSWQSGNADTATDAQVITAMAEAHPGMNVLWCVEGTCPAAAQPGLSAAGLSSGQVYVLGIDDVATTIAAIKSGWVSVSLNQCYFAASPLAAQLIKASLSGHPVAKKLWTVPVDPITEGSLPYKGCPASAVPTMPGQ